MKIPAITLTLLAALVVGPLTTGTLGHDEPSRPSGTVDVLADGPVDPNSGDTGWGG